MKMRILNFPREINEELAEETGWHIGDGSMNYYINQGRKKGIYQLRGHIEDDRRHYITRIKPIFKRLYGIDISLRDMPSTRVFGFQIWSDDLIKFKESLGLPIGPKISIVIPDKFLANETLRVAVLRGIFDTDGCVYLQKKNGKLYPRMEIKTISISLAEQLKEIFNWLGLRTTMYKESMPLVGKKRESYSVVIRGEKMFHKFIEKISPKNQKHLAKYIRFTDSSKALKMTANYQI